MPAPKIEKCLLMVLRFRLMVKRGPRAAEMMAEGGGVCFGRDADRKRSRKVEVPNEQTCGRRGGHAGHQHAFEQSLPLVGCENLACPSSTLWKRVQLQLLLALCWRRVRVVPTPTQQPSRFQPRCVPEFCAVDGEGADCRADHPKASDACLHMIADSGCTRNVDSGALTS